MNHSKSKNHLMGSLLENSCSSGRHAALLSTNRSQLLDDSLRGQRVAYLDSGYSEEDPESLITSCLMKTPSGNIFIPPVSNKPKNSLESRFEYRYVSSPSSSPTKDSSQNSDRQFFRETLQFGAPGEALGYSGRINGLLDIKSTSGGGGDRHRRSQKKNLQRRLQFIITWKCTGIFFIFCTIILSALLSYIVASNFLAHSTENAQACAVVIQDSSNIRSSKGSSLNPESIKKSRLMSSSSDNNNEYEDQRRNSPPESTSFVPMAFDVVIKRNIHSYGYMNLQFYQPENGYVSFDLRILKEASLGFYLRRNSLPTHTHYDIYNVIVGNEDLRRSKRSAERFLHKKINHFMVEGHWFLSLYNDAGGIQEMEILVNRANDLTESCPSGCSEHGECILGRCQCESGYDGDDCSQNVCPLLCSGRGNYQNGECICHYGWKGKDCTYRNSECEVPDCSGHGQCVEGQCICIQGYYGTSCKDVNCEDPKCSSHGTCVYGSCVCSKGWRGRNCSEFDEEIHSCLPNCSGNGQFKLETGVCDCFETWRGHDCSIKKCERNCGSHGRCESDNCVCQKGWKGDHCNEKSCDERCFLHGQCQNGTCLCDQGWNGAHCNLEGCSSHCTTHGTCKRDLQGDWFCDCETGWHGLDCRIQYEVLCTDGRDNDRDGLVDCHDPECCEFSECDNHESCLTVPKPIELLLQRQPPSPTASFYQKMKFIIEEESLQKLDRHSSSLNESRVSVLRGRVVLASGQGLIGVKVTHYETPSEGYTLSQRDGWFDFLVNGGGAVTLKFTKILFSVSHVSVFVPWNEVVVINDVVMNLESYNTSSGSKTVSCLSHDDLRLTPLVMTSWKLSSKSAYFSNSSAVIAESRVLIESLPLPNSNVNLVYTSSRRRGYLSTIQLQLTPSLIHNSLQKVFLIIIIEGHLFKKTFEADRNLKYLYSWQRLNIYRQRVYGTTTAVVKVGYFYSHCSQILWNVQTTRISGQDYSVSDIGGWDISIHHRYNPVEGILYRGDGSNFFLREQPRLLFTESTFQYIKPTFVVCGADGSIYVADFNVIIRIQPNGTIIKVLKLKENRSFYKMYLAIHGTSLYVSDPEAYRIIQVLNLEVNVEEIDTNWIPLIGSGLRCLPSENCGDGGLATQARLVYPKGLTISAEGLFYFADGTSIRVVNERGVISTLLGQSTQFKSTWSPFPCHGTTSAQHVILRWPTELAINPLDNTLVFIDDNLIFKVTKDHRVVIIGGHPLHCHSSSFSLSKSLVSPVGISFSPDGQLFVAESDSVRINRISILGNSGQMNIIAGRESKCNCLEFSCSCLSPDHILAKEAVLGAISSLAVGPDNALYVCEEGNRRLRSIKNSLPSLNPSLNYEILSPESQELYVFNRFGLHLWTRYISSKEPFFTFSYSVSTSNGQLIGISDRSGAKINILRNYAKQVTSIENPLNQKCTLTMDRKSLLTVFKYPDNNTVSFTYHRSNELISRRRLNNDGNVFVYDYDTDGRLLEVFSPRGEILELTSDYNYNGAIVNISQGSTYTSNLLWQPNSILVSSVGNVIETFNMKSLSRDSKYGSTFVYKTGSYDGIFDKYLEDSFPFPFGEKTFFGSDVINSFEWHFIKKKKKGKILSVNGINLLSIITEYPSTIISFENFPQIKINISNLGSILRISSIPEGKIESMILEKNEVGLPISWTWGSLKRKYSYDALYRLTNIEHGESSEYKSRRSYFPGNEGSDKPFKINNFLLVRDSSGFLSAISTPKGHSYRFKILHVLGIKRLYFGVPMSSTDYEIHFDQEERLVGKVWPSHKIIYVYDESSRLKNIIGGSSCITFHYLTGLSLLKTISRSDETLDFEYKAEFKYHFALLQESTQSFNNPFFHTISHTYQYDDYGRLALLSTQIGQFEKKNVSYKYDGSSGVLLGMFDYKIKRESLFKSTLEDGGKNFLRVKNFDSYGRVNEISLYFNSVHKISLHFSHDEHNNIQTIRSSDLMIKSIYSYGKHTENFLTNMSSSNGNNWSFAYDVNGNRISITENDKATSLLYDEGDRIVQFGESVRVDYDDRGYVTSRGSTKFTYNGLGQMLSAEDEINDFRISFYYDGSSRLIAKRDHEKQLVIQYIYGNPVEKFLITHIHYPNEDKTIQILYDETYLPLALESPDQRIYIATDVFGTPHAVFDAEGKVLKRLEHSPLGYVISDSNPSLYIPFDFHGGLLDEYTKLIHFGDRVYDSILGQWMTPLLETTGINLKDPSDIFTYRFHNNNPLFLKFKFMNELKDWIQLFGYDFNQMMGSEYSLQGLQNHPVSLSRKSLFVQIGMIGAFIKAKESLQNPNLIPDSVYLTQIHLESPVLSSQNSILGSSLFSGLLLSENHGVIRLTLNEESNENFSLSLLSSLLNGSLLLLHPSSNTGNILYCLRETGSFHDDLEKLLRLSDSYNITTEELKPMGRIICVSHYFAESSLCLMYGVNSKQGSRHVLRMIHKETVKKAWTREFNDYQSASSKWSSSQRNEYIYKGEVKGYTPVEIFSLHKYPQLIGVASNIIFLKDSEVQVWRGRRRKY